MLGAEPDLDVVATAADGAAAVEAGIALTGTEVKSLREGRANIAESYASVEEGELWLINANIPEYLQANRFNHEPRRPRKLLLHRKQIDKLMGAVGAAASTAESYERHSHERCTNDA